MAITKMNECFDLKPFDLAKFFESNHSTKHHLSPREKTRFKSSGASPCSGVAPRQPATYPPKAHARSNALAGDSFWINNEVTRAARKASPAPTVSPSLLIVVVRLLYPAFS